MGLHEPEFGRPASPANGQSLRFRRHDEYDSATGRVVVRYPHLMRGDRLRLAVVGAGYVGIATAVGLAEQGHDIVLVEREPTRARGAGGGPDPVP